MSACQIMVGVILMLTVQMMLVHVPANANQDFLVMELAAVLVCKVVFVLKCSIMRK